MKPGIKNHRPHANSCGLEAESENMDGNVTSKLFDYEGCNFILLWCAFFTVTHALKRLLSLLCIVRNYNELVVGHIQTLPLPHLTVFR